MKLRLGPVADRYEAEADRIAERVMRMRDPAVRGPVSAVTPVRVQRMCTECQEEERVQRCCDGERQDQTARRQPEEEEEGEAVQAKRQIGAASAPARPAIEEDLLRPKLESGRNPPRAWRSMEAARSLPSGVEQQIRAGRAHGTPLPASARAFFEPRMGYDFGGVRVHTGTGAASSARALSARAFTLGRDVIFAAGAYRPAAADGRRLLAHELAHVAQQGHAPRRATPSSGWARRTGPWSNLDGASPARSMVGAGTALAGGVAAAAAGVSRAACCSSALAAGLDDGDYGGVICCNNLKRSCVWQRNINARRANATARGIIGPCVRAHENTHLDDVDCSGAAVERPNFRADRDPDAEECAAYRTEVHCYNRRIDGCGADADCLRDVGAERRFARSQIRSLC